MNARVVHLSTFEWIDICIPIDARPTDRLLPVVIDDDSLEQAGIFRNDIAIVNLAGQPCQGQFVAIETLQEFLLGYYFELLDGLILVESACRCAQCPPRYLRKTSILNLSPVSWLCRRRGNVCYVFSYYNSMTARPQLEKRRLR